jgi:hemerythrin-like domain-containing protein
MADPVNPEDPTLLAADAGEFEETTLGEHGRHGKPLPFTDPEGGAVMTDGDEAPVTVEGPPDPLRRLQAFHGQIRAALKSLELLASGEDSDGTVHANASAIIDFFSGPLVWHDIDEETSLLPRLRRVKHSKHLDEMVAAVQRQHEAMEGLVERVLPHLEAAAHDRTRDLDGFERISRELIDVLDEHLQLEERELFPFARLALTEADLEEMDAEIRHRTATRARGLPGAIEVP